ncbi:MAG: dockerin [Fibrobacter sp.]|nr:dockerin [Fibrobacter sp.]
MKHSFFKSLVAACVCGLVIGCGSDKPSAPSDSPIPGESSSSFELPGSSAIAGLSSSTTEIPLSSMAQDLTSSSSQLINPASSSSQQINSVSSSSEQQNPMSQNSETFDSMFFGAWVGGPEEVPQPTVANVEAFEKLQGRHLDIIHHFVLWQYNDWAWTQPYAEMARSRGSIMMITWMPQPYTAQDILDGITDDYLDDFADGVKNFQDEIWLRPLHESNGDWYTWSTGKDPVKNAEDKVAAAFRYIVERFRAKNVTNVKWVWTTNASNSGAKSTLKGSYPGNDYVDYTSIDGYNWGSAQSWSSWQSFSQVFKAAYRAIEGFNKPMFIAEFSCTEHGGSKAEWFKNMFEVLPTEFPKIKGLVIFSQSKNTEEADWGLDTSNESINAWKEGIAAFPAAKRN